MNVMNKNNNRPLWLYPLFQIPGILMGLFLLLALLFWLFSWGRPAIAVNIALDLSGSTYGSSPLLFNAPNTVMAQEVGAVRSYIEQSSQQLKIPNQIQVMGFGGQVVPLTSQFLTDRQQLETELTQSLADPNLRSRIGDGTSLDRAIEQGAKALGGIAQHCRELLIVTDGEADVSPTVIAQAASQGVRINAVVVGANAPQLQIATIATKGIYLSGAENNLQTFFTDNFFHRFNSNLRWIALWLGAAWVALMWLLTLPLDRWIFQGWLGLPMNLSGQLSLGNALFWSVLTPLILWQIWQFLGLPFFSSC
jgi:Ca-activated chloride channel homolog